MPTYQYNCPDCDCFQDVIRPMTSEEVMPECPHCSKEMLRVYNSAPVQFKGTGFYKTGG